MRLVRKSKTILLVSLAFWLLAVSSGLKLILSYESTAGASGQPPAEWPAESRIRRAPGMPTLVMMVHPHCPCSRASVGELALLMVAVQGRVNANVVFVKPKGFAEDWEKTNLWSSAAIIPGVSVSVDDEGVDASRFHSQTSGQVMLYSADGELLFSGGITAARGHSGDNAGRSAIVALLTSDGSAIKQTPVFGCPLFNKDANEKSKDSCESRGN
jgi:hypothetical protein